MGPLLDRKPMGPMLDRQQIGPLLHVSTCFQMKNLKKKTN
jgi:hypothetical protein